MSRFGIISILGLCSGALVTGRPLTHEESFNYWSQVINEVPVQVHGSLPGYPEPAIAALLAKYPKPALMAFVDGDVRTVASVDRSADDPRRVVLSIDPSTDMNPAQVCRGGASLQERPQNGRRARVDAVLCNGNEAVAATEGTLPVTGQSDSDIKNSIAAVKDSLVNALRPVTD
jgi:hypothetical protein